MPDDTETRIRKKAHMLWEEAGRPEGRAEDHWDKARILVAIEDDRTSLKPVAQVSSEPLEIQDNLGELPGALTDQGDRMQVPAEELASRAQDRAAVRRKPAVRTGRGSEPQRAERGGEGAAVKKTAKRKR